MEPGTWHGEDYHLGVWVRPRASREGVAGLRGQDLCIALNAPPVEGAANRALTRFLAEELGIAKNRVVLLSGEHARNKRLCLKKISKEALHAFFVRWGVVPNHT